MNDSINEVLDLEPYEEPKHPVVVKEDSSTVDQDFEFARDTLTDAISKGQEALNGIVDVASMSQNPRAFEVVATLISAVSNASKDLMELSKKKKEITGIGEPQGPSTVNQNLFVGSTAELLKMLKGKQD